LFANRNPRKRKSFSFETLEARYAFSTTPLNYETTSYSSDTAEGAAALLLREMQWAALQAASSDQRTIETLMLPSDPYFPNPNDPSQMGQWHLLNLGQEVGNPDFQNIFGLAGEDINVVPAWNLGYTGAGILVGVIDDGVQMTHPDLRGNIHPFFRFNALNGTSDANPGNLLTPSHGTATAGLIGATWSLEVIGGNNGDDDDDDDDDDGSGATAVIVTSGGGVGVAPEVTLVPIRFLGPNQNPLSDPMVEAFTYALQVGLDITNNSWGFVTNRQTVNLTEQELQILRDSVIFGRDGLGMINVFSSGNSGGPGAPAGFEGFGIYDSAAYNPLSNSRYTITVTGVDHDGGYNNSDGSITSYPEAGPNVLVAAPTGSNAAQNIANDNGQGSGIWTTDLVGNFGYNAASDPITGIDDDRDFLADPNYTSRFNGTSAAAPLVSGVIALMLDANPNLTYRDVQEILLRSARQNAQFEIPQTGAGDESFYGYSTWQTNQFNPFREPDAWLPAAGGPFLAIYDPIADPTLTSFPRIPTTWPTAPAFGNDIGRQEAHYESQPAEFTNGAGYTVSQGYGAYNELIGYGHGVVDAELAVIMARDWHDLDQQMPPSTEKTFSTFIVPTGLNFPAAERGSQDSGFVLVPGGIGGRSGFIAFWNEYFADPPAPFDPANPDSWPDNTRGSSYLDFRVPVNQQINVETVEVKLTLSGDPADLPYIKMNLTSPSGMQSELNHYWADPDFPTPLGTQELSFPSGRVAVGPLTDSNTFTWTFTTNRNWGESTNAAVIMDPLTGEPVLGPGDQPILRDWELHLENWSNSTFGIAGVEIVWHGKPVSGGQLDQDWLAFDEDWDIPVAQRIQGIVGIDVNNDDEFSGVDPTVSNEFNNRYIQERVEVDGDLSTIRSTEIQRRLLDDFIDNDFDGVFTEGDVRLQEPFAANVLVEAFRFTVDGGGNDIVENQPVAQFLTGADGNYYFDLLPGNYYIRVTDRGDTPATPIDDPNTPAGFLQHYKDEWRLTADWFVAPDRAVPVDTDGDGDDDIPGEILFDNVTQAPVPYIMDVGQPAIPKNVTNINFLLKPPAFPANEVVVSGTVWADVNADGNIDTFDAPIGNMRVYHDVNRNGQYDDGEQFVTTSNTGTSVGDYSITILATEPNTFVIGVDLEPGWTTSIVGGDQIELFMEPGETVANQDFFLNPPNDPSGSGPANITGFIFNDLDADGQKDPGENGIAGVRVFIDDPLAPNGMWDPVEIFTFTSSTGGYFFADVDPGVHRVDVQIDNEGTGAALYNMTVPAAGFREVTVTAGATATNVTFGLDNRADLDWGDLPDTFNTTEGAGGPSHFVVPHFRLGSTIDGEVDGQPTADAMGDDNVDGISGVDDVDDGVSIFSGGGVLHPGLNTLEITVFGVGGLLSGWIDWDNDGTFDSGERLSFTDATSGEVYGQEAEITPGTHKLNITAPAVIPTAQLGARFRWGESGLGLSDAAFIGEVEDYYLSSSAVVLAPVLGGDFNNDGSVDAADFVMYKKLVGTQTSIPNGTNPNWVVPADHEMWKDHYGTSSGSGGGGGSSQSTAPEADPPANPAPVAADSIAGATSNEPISTGVPDSVVDTSVSSPSVTVESPSVSSRTFVSISFDTGASTSFSTAADDVFEANTVSSESQSYNLLLLDEAWADLDDVSDDVVAVTNRSGEKEDGYGDLELAAVFDDESAWWAL
jgi:hypothetical protein